MGRKGYDGGCPVHLVQEEEKGEKEENRDERERGEEQQRFGRSRYFESAVAAAYALALSRHEDEDEDEDEEGQQQEVLQRSRHHSHEGAGVALGSSWSSFGLDLEGEEEEGEEELWCRFFEELATVRRLTSTWASIGDGDGDADGDADGDGDSDGMDAFMRMQIQLGKWKGAACSVDRRPPSALRRSCDCCKSQCCLSAVMCCGDMCTDLSKARTTELCLATPGRVRCFYLPAAPPFFFLSLFYFPQRLRRSKSGITRSSSRGFLPLPSSSTTA